MSNNDEDRKTRSPIVAALGTLFFVSLCVLFASQIIDAFLTGRTRFPMKYNNFYVTWAEHPGWFTASVVAWLLLTALMAYPSILGWKLFRRLVRGVS